MNSAKHPLKKCQMTSFFLHDCSCSGNFQFVYISIYDGFSFVFVFFFSTSLSSVRLPMEFMCIWQLSLVFVFLSFRYRATHFFFLSRSLVESILPHRMTIALVDLLFVGCWLLLTLLLYILSTKSNSSGWILFSHRWRQFVSHFDSIEGSSFCFSFPKCHVS